METLNKGSVVDQQEADKGEASSLTKLEKVVAIMVTIATTWTAIQTNNVKNDVTLQTQAIDQVKVQIAVKAEERESKKLNHEMTLKIFEAVNDIYKIQNQTADQVLNRLLAVAALVEAVPDRDVRVALAHAVNAAAENAAVLTGRTTDEISHKTEAVKSRVDITVFRADQNDVESVGSKDMKALSLAASKSSASTPHWANYDFDFFWCETSSDPDGARQAAERAMNNLKKLDPNASGRWRIRKLPAEINARAGYKVNGYKIHATSPDEVKIAGSLKDLLKQQGFVPDGQEFEIKQIKYESPWYLSVFFCQGAISSP